MVGGRPGLGGLGLPARAALRVQDGGQQLLLPGADRRGRHLLVLAVVPCAASADGHARPETRIDRYRSALPDDPPGRLWAFYGSGWDTGQCYSDTGVLGPWTRAPTGNPRPIGNWSDGGPENPLVFKSRSGVYLLIWAANLLQVEHGLAFAWSKDGVNWEDNTGGGIRTGKAGYMIPVSPPGHVAFRTPLALVEHEERDNFFTLFFTAFENDHANPAAPIGGYENAYASEVELVLTF